jgi:membrane AbrB-like protein
MLLSGAVHLAGFTNTQPPTFAVNFAQVVLGTAIGCRFVGTALKQVLSDLGLGFGAAVSMLFVAVGFSALIAAITDISMREAFLGYSPGGIAEMGLLALALGGDIAFIAANHVGRITLVITAAPIAFKILNRNK